MIFLESLDELKGNGLRLQVLFIEASNEIIRRRYKETRRKHPLSDKAKGSIDDAINAEPGDFGACPPARGLYCG